MPRMVTAIVIAMLVLIAGCSEKPGGGANQQVGQVVKPPGQPKRGVHWTELTASDRKSALTRDYPEAIRGGLTDEQLAAELNLQTWAFDFTGGPLWCWFEVEEIGQKTVELKKPAKRSEGFYFDVPSGHVILSVGRGVSQRMQRTMQTLGKDGDPDSIAIIAKFASSEHNKSGSFTSSHGSAPLWFGWMAHALASGFPAPPLEFAPDGKEFTLLRVDANEGKPPMDQESRKVTLLLKGVFGPAPE